MCRAIAQGGRRCPYHGDPRVLALQSARQAAKRMEQRLERDEARGISDSHLQTRVQRLVGAYERVNSREQVVKPAHAHHRPTDAEHAPIGPPKPSAADSITAERVNSMSWDEVSELSRDLNDDPAAWQKLETLVNEREERERKEAEFNEWIKGTPTQDDDQVSNPAARPSRKLTAHERAREEYDSYVASQYFKAEDEVGFMLNAEGRAKGIDAYSLFSGPASRAKKYGSEELQAWFGRNGRHTLSSYRHSVLGWGSDRKAAERSRVEDFSHVPNI